MSVSAELRSEPQPGPGSGSGSVRLLFSSRGSWRQRGVFRVVTLSLAREHEIRTTIESSGAEEEEEEAEEVEEEAGGAASSQRKETTDLLQDNVRLRELIQRS